MHDDKAWWSENPDFYHLELESTSPLYAKLCEVNAVTGQCSLPSKVVLDSNLVYDEVDMAGAEYSVDTIRTVKMKIGSKTVWYEYVRVACVEHSFYRDAKRVVQGKTTQGSREEPVRAE